MAEQSNTTEPNMQIDLTLHGFTTTTRMAFQAYQQPDAGAAIVFYVTDEEFGNEEPFGVATVNMASYGSPAADGCVWIKDYAENEGMVESLTKAGVIELTGNRVPTGFVEVHEARVIAPYDTLYFQAIVEGNAMRAQTVADSGAPE